MLKCWNPPPLSILRTKLIAGIRGYITGPNKPRLSQVNAHWGLIASLQKRDPNVQWVISMLSIYAPDDPIFAKDYKYVRPRDEYDLWCDNEDDLFTGLAPLTEKEIRKTNRLRMPRK